MRNYQKSRFLHPNNKLGEYIKINKTDKFIRDFIDYIGFYWDWEKTDWRYLFMSDNSPSAYVDRIQLKAVPASNGRFQCYAFYSVMWYTVDLFRIKEIKLGEKMVMKIDFYWKWILVVNRENLWASVEKIFSKFFGMNEIYITRTDYTADCAKYNFRKENTLGARIAGIIEKVDNVEYKLFGRKGKSAKLIRYYDKKKELKERWTAWLYPEYLEFNEIMRYELQVNSEGFDKYERILTIQKLKDYANFGLYIAPNASPHIRTREETILEWIKRWIRKLVRDKDKESLEKVDLYLEDLKNRWIIDSLVWCETSEVVKPMEHFLNSTNLINPKILSSLMSPTP